MGSLPTEENEMDNTRNTKNYAAHGGAEWVIGGKLTFLPGATVEGGEGLFDAGVDQIPYQADSTATTVAALKEEFNTLLAGLRSAGIMAADVEQETTETDPETPAGGDG